jgi:soluble lytic murein transglycosylase-like protein
MTWALALILAATAADFRIPLVERQIAGDPRGALEAAAAAAEERPEEAAEAGVSYLRGRLLETLGHQLRAEHAYEEALSEAPELEPWTRYRAALGHERGGHPEVATGLVAGVIDPDTPEDLLARATELFARSIEGGGDCRVLHGVMARTGDRLPDHQRRILEVAEAGCADEAGDELQAGLLLCAVLAENREDDPGRLAAERLDSLLGRIDPLRRALAVRDCDAEREVGLTLHHHRQFELSVPYLEGVAGRLGGRRTVSSDEELEVLYAIARGYFWREEFAVAAERFGDLVLRTRDLEERARVLYQQARSQELDGDWQEADRTFRKAFLTDREGPLAGPALLSAVRLEWRGGSEQSALDLMAVLGNLTGGREYASRAYLFLAVSDLVRGRGDRAVGWLAAAERLDRDSAYEAEYWRGRWAELGAHQRAPGAATEAVDRYLEVALGDAYHPLAVDARERLRTPILAGAVEAEARRRAASGRPEGQLAAWLLRGEGSLEGRAARRAMVVGYASDPDLAPFYRLTRVPVARWPAWQRDLDRAPEMLLGLGLVDDGAPAVRRLFGGDDPNLAYTGSRMLLEAERVPQAILFAAAFARPVLRRVPDVAQPPEIRTLIYPLAWGERIEAESRRFGIDPHLLAGIIREESRYDPRALSGASARGLTQFVHLTARRLAPAVGLGVISPDDLYQPRVAITLGAAYLAELSAQFDGTLHQAVAAYNAGPAQARLWQAYCYGRELPEYFSKTGFVQTRGYLRKVLSSKAQYEELYPGLD